MPQTVKTPPAMMKKNDNGTFNVSSSGAGNGFGGI